MEPLAQSSETRFADYVDALATVIWRGDRAGPLKDYCVGLLMPGECKSVEPMAAVVAPARVSAKHQSLLHLVGQASWSDETVLAKARELALPAIEAQGKIEAWIVDDTGFAKKVHSVGVARQYCGRLGQTDNCQIAVSKPALIRRLGSPGQTTAPGVQWRAIGAGSDRRWNPVVRRKAFAPVAFVCAKRSSAPALRARRREARDRCGDVAGAISRRDQGERNCPSRADRRRSKG